MLKRLQNFVLLLLVLILSCLIVPNAARICVEEFVTHDQMIDLDSETETENEEEVETIEILVAFFSKTAKRPSKIFSNSLIALNPRFNISNIYLDIDTPPPVL